jgi:hypothetical protein
MISRLALGCVVAGSLLVGVGCDSGGRRSVTGKVLYNGQPAAGATVTFVRKDSANRLDDTMPQGTVEADGTFTLAGPTGKGVPPGEYIVLVEWKEGAGKVKGRAPALGAPDRLKKKYLDPNHPQLTATVDDKTSRLPPFELN